MNLLTAIAVSLLAVPPETPVKIGVADFAPMIVVDNKTGEISGSDFDLFESLADDPSVSWKRGEDYEYVVVNSFDALLSKVASGELDMALDGISITHERLGDMDFSQPYKNSGQRIMASYMGEISIWSQMRAYIGQFFRMEILFALIAFILNCFFWGAIVWVVERFFWARSHPPAPGSKEIVRVTGEEPNITNLESGTLAAFDAGTTIGYGRFYPVTRVGQLVIVAAFFCGAIVVGNVISTLTTDKIVHHLEGEITGPEDLKGKVVAVVNGTTSEAVVREYNPGQVVECDDFYKAVVQLRLGEADAVIADDPVILNYLKENPSHGSLAGEKFHPEDYGIAFSPNSDKELIKTFSMAIARLRESGKLAMIESQWFGE